MRRQQTASEGARFHKAAHMYSGAHFVLPCSHLRATDLHPLDLLMRLVIHLALQPRPRSLMPCPACGSARGSSAAPSRAARVRPSDRQGTLCRPRGGERDERCMHASGSERGGEHKTDHVPCRPRGGEGRAMRAMRAAASAAGALPPSRAASIRPTTSPDRSQARGQRRSNDVSDSAGRSECASRATRLAAPAPRCERAQRPASNGATRAVAH